MGQGLLTITNVANDDPGPPNRWLLTVTNSAGVTPNDHLTGEIAGGVDAVWRVFSVPLGTQVVVIDDLTEGNGGAEYGAPVAASAGYKTPTPIRGLTLGAEGAPGWRALNERNLNVIDGLL